MKKPHLVIVCGILYPNPSPTGLCAYRYATLLADKYDIEFISISNNGREENGYYEGIPVHTLSSWRLRAENRSKGIIRQMIHLVGSAQLKFTMNGNLEWYADAAYRKLEEIHIQRPIDVLLTVCSPLPAHIAGIAFKKKHPCVRHCAYTVDPYAASDRIIPFGKSFSDLVEYEYQISNQTDCLFLSEEAINMRQDIYGRIKQKVALPYLLPKSPITEGDKFDKKHIHCVYAGSFYKDIRNPEYMLKVFSTFKDKKVKLYLYSSGCNDLVNGFAEMSDNIEANGYVSQKELQEIYASCDVLIGVGNAMNDFLPSKTYEYLSWRKPIVFFNPKGYENIVLTRYPLSLQLYDNECVCDAGSKLESFIDKYFGKTLSEDELYEKYSANTASNIKKILIREFNHFKTSTI